VVVVAMLVSVRRGLRAAELLLRQATVPVASIRPGRVEVRGRLVSVDPVVARPGEPECVAVTTSVEWLKPGKHGGWTMIGRFNDGGAAVLRDDSGECAVVIDGAEIVGERWTVSTNVSALLHTDPSLASRAQVENYQHATALRLVRTWIPNGAEVIAFGDAVEAGVSSGVDYRSTVPRYAIRDLDEQQLLLSTYSHTRTIWALVAPALALGAAAVVLLTSTAIFGIFHLRLLLALGAG
jgi:hypothetical protein